MVKMREMKRGRRKRSGRMHCDARGISGTFGA
jgi:hypothetical protein